MRGNTTAPACTRNSSAKREASWVKKLLFALLASCLFLGIVEGTLRLIGFRFLAGAPEVVINGQVVGPMFRHTRTVVFEPIPDSEWFNADGFVGPTIPVARVPGVLRIATMGDSCTQFGEPPYPAVLRECLTQRLGEPVEVLNAGVACYSTEQGLPRLQARVLPYRPDVVTLYFGWNDHWIVDRFTDAERAAEEAKSWGWLEHVGWSRLVQVGLYGAHMIHEQRSWRMAKQLNVVRVPEDQFRENLRRMIAVVRSASATPMLVTPPTDMTRDTPIEAFDSLKSMAGSGYETPKDLHDAYVEIVRQLARETQTPLVDAARAFDGRPRLNTRDHVHLSPEGVRVMGELIAEQVLATLPHSSSP